jgi:hypothetical protein
MKTKQKNFRMTLQSVELLDELRKKYGVTDTEIVEYAIARYARNLGLDADKATALLVKQIGMVIGSEVEKATPPPPPAVDVPAKNKRAGSRTT